MSTPQTSLRSARIPVPAYTPLPHSTTPIGPRPRRTTLATTRERHAITLRLSLSTPAFNQSTKLDYLQTKSRKDIDHFILPLSPPQPQPHLRDEMPYINRLARRRTLEDAAPADIKPTETPSFKPELKGAVHPRQYSYPSHLPSRMSSSTYPPLMSRQAFLNGQPLSTWAPDRRETIQTLPPKRAQLQVRNNCLPLDAPESRPSGGPVLAEQIATSSDKYLPNEDRDRKHLQEIAHGVFLAFEDGLDSTPDEGDPFSQNFTHIVNIRKQHDSQPSDLNDGGPTYHTTDLTTGTQILNLTLPKRPSNPVEPLTESALLATQEFLSGVGRTFTLGHLRYILSDGAVPDGYIQLTKSQLIAARDFLMSSGHDIRRTTSPGSTTSMKIKTRILVTTPASHPADAIAAAVCYLAAASGENTRNVLSHFNGTADTSDSWKNVIGVEGFGAVFVEEVARI